MGGGHVGVGWWSCIVGGVRDVDVDMQSRRRFVGRTVSRYRVGDVGLAVGGNDHRNLVGASYDIKRIIIIAGYPFSLLWLSEVLFRRCQRPASGKA